MRTYLCAFILATSLMLVATRKPKGYMDTVYQWKYIDYLWESEASRQMAIENGDYNFTVVSPVDLDRDKDGRVFISILGRKGVPATLATVTNVNGPSGPLLKPYPDWSYFKKGDCNSITSVYRIKIDECNRLWVLDTGVPEDDGEKCEPQLLAFNLQTDSLIERIKIPTEIAGNKNGQTLLATPIVETEGTNCEKTTVYMADTSGKGLVVWNGVRLVRLENPVFNPDENARNVVVGNYNISLNSGIVTMDISPRLFPDEERFLYFHALSSYDIYVASTEVLKRSTYGESIRFLGKKNVLSSQAIGTAFSSEGTLFLGLTKELAIACWNKYRPLVKHNFEIVAQDDTTMQFISGMKVLKNYIGQRVEEELWAFSNRWVRFQVAKLDYSEYNYRILASPVKRLIRDTFCQLPRQTINALMAIRNDSNVLSVST